jgi:hypothetical protein
MNNYILLNGQVINDDATLADLRYLIQAYNAKVTRAYTFQMRYQIRRVIRLEAQGPIYSVYSKMRPIAYNAWTQTPLLFTFDKHEAYALAEQVNGEVNEYEARTINFSQPHLKNFNKELKF